MSGVISSERIESAFNFLDSQALGPRNQSVTTASYSLPTDYVNFINQLAARYGVSKSHALRMIIEGWLEAIPIEASP